MFKNNKKLKIALIIVCLMSLIFIIYNATSQEQIIIDDYSEDMRILMENNEDMKILNRYSTDSFEHTEGYVISIENIEMFVLIVNELPTEAESECFKKHSKGTYRIINDKYLFIFYGENPEAIEILNNLTL